jgi:hypothetical protein
MTPRSIFCKPAGAGNYFDPQTRICWHLGREEWFRLPLELRRRWWRDTDYGKRPPSPEMVEAIEDERRHPERVQQRRQEHERLAQEAREQNRNDKPIDLRQLKAEMAAAHPDRGGSSAAFIAAREKYQAARRRAPGGVS